MKIFNEQFFCQLTTDSKMSPRCRQHRNVHSSFDDPCQRLFNAIQPNSYIRPHRHFVDSRDEMLIALQGSMALLTFDDEGEVVGIMGLGTGIHEISEVCVAVEIPSSVWHTVIALEQDSVLLEIKAGPFDPQQAKEFAIWSPEEGTPEAGHYLSKLVRIAKGLTTAR